MADPKVKIEVNVDGSQGVAELGKLKEGLKAVQDAIPSVSAEMKGLAGAAKESAKGIETMAQSTQEAADRASAPVQNTKRDIRGVGTESVKASAGLSQMSSRLDRIKDAALSIPGVGTALLAVGSAAAVVATITAGLAKSIREFADTENSLARLEAAMANMGSATGANIGRMKQLADEMQRATGIAGREWLGTITKLVQAGSTPASIGMDLEAVKNLTGLVGSLDTATMLYTRALQGSYEQFSKYGIVLDEAGTATQKLAALQEQAARRGSGVLEASTQTLSGQFRGLWNAISGAAEATGQWAAKTGIVQSVLWSATEILQGFAEKAGSAYDRLGLLNKQTEGTAEALSRYREHAAAVLRITQDSIVAINAEVDAMRKKQGLLDQLTDKGAALKKAEIDLSVAEGKMTPQQGIRRKAQIDVESTKEKAKREIDQANLEEQKQKEKVDLIQQQKDKVDQDLRTESSALKKDEARARLRQMVGTRMATVDGEEDSAGTAALLGSVGFNHLMRIIPRRGVFRLLGEAEDASPENDVGLWRQQLKDRKEQRRAFLENAERLTENRSAERSGRVSELRTMSSTLGEQLARESGVLSEITPATRTRVAVATADTATAELNAATQITNADRGGLESTVPIAQSLPSNLSAGFKAWENTFKELRDIAVSAHQSATNANVMLRQTKRDLEMQQKNAANR